MVLIVGLDNLPSQKAKDIALKFNFTSELRQIDSYENFLYEVGNNVGTFILRISHGTKRDKRMIEAEIAWINYLTKHGINAAKPFKSINGLWVEEDNLENFRLFAVVFEKIEGQLITDDHSLLTPNLFRKWGMTMAQIHNLSDQFNQASLQTNGRQQWDEIHEITDMEEILVNYPVILNKMKTLVAKISGLAKEDYGMIHHDFHESNFLVNKSEIFLIDFDDCQYNYYIADIAVSIFHFHWRFGKSNVYNTKEFYTEFVNGYQSERTINPKWITLLPDFIQLRFFLLFNTVVFESQLGFDEFGQKLIQAWKPLLEQDIPWIEQSLLV